ncbi:MAG: 4-amino-4-deoxychorismate lyase [Gammaproteobacteria bacterium]|nr:4-amino-4-deoxychorismate lyase [Gammaproteobacteria bacterium]
MARERSSDPQIVLLNGVPAQQVSPLDRALHFGDGLFETIACRGGVPRFLSLHLERLELGCTRLGIDPGNLDAIRSEVRALAGEVDSAIVKVLLSRGTALARGYGVTGREKATRITFRYAWPHETPSGSQDGVQVRTAAMRLGENPALAGLKHCNRLEQVLARREWTDPDISEALLFSSSGRLVSGTMSNVFIVAGSRLSTPRIDLCGVAGIMRRVVLHEAATAGVPVQEDVLTAEDLRSADELFLTNARIGIWPVRTLDGRRMPPGPITRRLQELIAPLLEEPADA